MDMDEIANPLRQEVAALAERLRALEAQVAQLSSTPAPEHSAVTQTTIAASSPETPQAVPPPPPHPATSASVEQTSDDRSLENRIGSQLFNRIGIIALFAGVAWFFKFAVDNGWLGPFMRVLLGLLSGSGIVLWSERFRRRGYAGFSYTLKAVGTGILYLTIWAAFSLYHFVPASVAFAGMVLVTLLNAWLALLENAELLAFYALSGAFATPLLLSTGVDHEIFLFSYLLLLNLAMFVLIARRAWTRLLVAAYPATVFYAIVWYAEHFDASKLGVSLFFAALFWLLYGVAPSIIQRNLRSWMGENAPRDNGWPAAGLPILHAVIAFGFLYTLLGNYGNANAAAAADARAWTALIFSAAYAGLTWLARIPRGRTPAFAVNASLAVAFCTLFVLLYFSGRTIVYGWLIEGLILVALSPRLRTRFAPAFAAVPLLLASLDLLLYDSFAGLMPRNVLFNARFGSFISAIAALVVAVLLTHEQAHKIEWRRFRAGAVLTMNLLTLVAVSREIQTYWHGSLTFFAERFSYSIWFMIYGDALLAAGFWRRSAFLRWQGLVLLAFTIAKVFSYDMANLSQGYRVLSLLGLGVLLLSVSFTYQRTRLRLREKA